MNILLVLFYFLPEYLIFQFQAMTFNQVIQTGPDEEGGDDKAVTAMGILNTIDTLLSVVEDHKEVSAATCPLTKTQCVKRYRVFLYFYSHCRASYQLMLPTTSREHVLFL